jgi:hypothetical protein
MTFELLTLELHMRTQGELSLNLPVVPARRLADQDARWQQVGPGKERLLPHFLGIVGLTLSSPQAAITALLWAPPHPNQG